MKFLPYQVRIEPQGEKYSAQYQKDGVSLDMELCFSKQVRERITVQNKKRGGKRRWNPFANHKIFTKASTSYNAYLQYTLERHIEKLAANNN